MTTFGTIRLRGRHDHKVPSSQAPPTRPRRSTVFVGAVTFLLAVWGAYTGTLAWRDDRRVVVHLSAQPYIGPQLGEGLIRFSIINQSRHAVAITGGDVLLQGRKIGTLASVLTDLRSVDLFSVASREFEQRSQLLPLGVGAESTTALAALWHTTDFDFALEKLDEANTLDDKELPVIRPSRTRLELRLHLVPGGERVVHVPVLAAPAADPDRDTGAASGWSTRLRLRSRRVTDMFVRSSEDRRRVATLKLWTTTSSKPIRTLTRPLGENIGRFRLDWLGRGTYVWALDDGHSVVGVGTLVQPCRSPEVAARRKPPDVSSGACSIGAQRQVRDQPKLDAAAARLHRQFERAARSPRRKKSLAVLRRELELKLRELVSNQQP